MSCKAPNLSFTKTKTASATFYYSYDGGTPRIYGSGTSVTILGNTMTGPCNKGTFHPLVKGFRRPTAYNGSFQDSPVIEMKDISFDYYGGWLKYFSKDIQHLSLQGVGCPQPKLTSVMIPDWDSGSLPIYWQDNCVNEATTRCLNKLQSIDVDLSVAWLERQKTLNLASDLVESIGDLMRAARKKSPGDIADGFAKLWLAARYGLGPAIMDLEGACKQLQKDDAGHYGGRYFVSAKARSFGERSGTTSAKNRSLGAYFPRQLDFSTQTKVKYGAFVRLDGYIDDSIHGYRQYRDLGLTNPLLTMWEILPYSFILDWFVGVGDFLEAFTAPIGLQFLGGSTTRYFRWDQEVLDISPSPGTGQVTVSQVSPGGGHVFNRAVHSYFPSPQIFVKSNPLNFKRFYDGLALLWGASRGRPGGRF